MNNGTKLVRDDQSEIKKNVQNIIDRSDSNLTAPNHGSKKTLNELCIYNEVSKDEEYELNEKEIGIIEFISKYPGCCKEYVVHRVGFSRPIVLKYIDRLSIAGFIICEIDKNDKRKQLLYINKQAALLALISNLHSFETSYSNLIDKMKSIGFETIIKDCRVGIRQIFSDYDLIRILFTTFTIAIHVSQFYILFNRKDYPSNSLSPAKIIVYDIFDRISSKLNAINLNRKYSQYREDVYFNSFSETNSIADTISELLKIMRICKLNQEIESVIDSLWNICIPALPSLDPFFSRFTKIELQNWKQIMNDFESSIYSKKRNYNPFLHKVMSSG